MSDLTEIITKDGSFTLRSSFFNENFHSLQGALAETKIKFINPSDLKRFQNKSIKVLDICFGLGYNSAYLFSELFKQNSTLDWYALEIDKKPLAYALENKYFHELWDPKILRIFNSLYQNNSFEDKFFKCNIFWGEARKKINNIPTETKFDLIFLDSFSPQKCPQLWSVEFLSKISEKLNPQGYLITYTSSAAVRKTLRSIGLEIFSIRQNLNSRNSWSQGTVAISKFDKKNLINNPHFKKLSLLEEEHLLTKASIPYRDPFLRDTKEDIMKKRLKEQLLSNLHSTNNWRDKWGMTKSTLKSKI